ncbi:hypothetical protein [Xenorhabdus cabanillasii]|uniref:Uncharacterized protein n=1 Tax=Xenorhabdus cabanillasii JM26 TaxID=1427517 RepID=W1IS02_9GAMM|nr:hypothetical protein [Xenorhabdus cabanillasii]PHM75339.1 hypothetical protein Xcab_04195 [Xenorhabdus cabanillasii JM26]CDL79990.1 conserved exported hypothetical protein [Xenorhabdus cabanillasii JM26]
MINKKISILAGLFLSLTVGTGMAAETKDSNNTGIVFPDNFHCTKFMTSGNYIGKLAYTVSLDSLVQDVYWFVSLESGDEGCIAVHQTNARHNKIAHDAFVQGKIVKIKLEGTRVKAIVH